MPLDLPGFYFDVTRNRYFPSSSRSTNPNGVAKFAHKEPDPITVPAGGLNGPARTLRRRRTDLQRDLKTTLGTIETFDALQ